MALMQQHKNVGNDCFHCIECNASKHTKRTQFNQFVKRSAAYMIMDIATFQFLQHNL